MLIHGQQNLNWVGSSYVIFSAFRARRRTTAQFTAWAHLTGVSFGSSIGSNIGRGLAMVLNLRMLGILPVAWLPISLTLSPAGQRREVLGLVDERRSPKRRRRNYIQFPRPIYQ